MANGKQQTFVVGLNLYFYFFISILFLSQRSGKYASLFRPIIYFSLPLETIIRYMDMYYYYWVIISRYSTLRNKKNKNKPRKLKFNDERLLSVDRIYFDIYFLMIISLNLWLRLHLKWSIRLVQFSMTHSSISIIQPVHKPQQTVVFSA